MSFIVLWFICCSSFVHFKNDPEYLTRGTTQVCIPLVRFLLCSFVSSNFLVFLRYSFFLNFFFHPRIFNGVYSTVFHWNLSDSMSPQISRSLLSSLASLKIAVVFIVSVLTLISISPILFYRPLRTVPSALATIGITVNSHVLPFQLPGKTRVFIYLFAFFFCHSMVCRNSKTKRDDKFFLSLINTWSGKILENSIGLLFYDRI